MSAPSAGKAINAAKAELEAIVAEKRADSWNCSAALSKEPTDFTLPGRRRSRGQRLHPLTQVTDDIVKAFRKLGFRGRRRPRDRGRVPLLRRAQHARRPSGP
jgi:phenylalanyl-tRNA synthetase alpha subunit